MDAKTILAYAALAYFIASGVYLFASACCLETPFRNSLTPQQIQIKQFSKNIRGNVFIAGLVIAILILFFWKPF